MGKDLVINWTAEQWTTVYNTDHADECLDDWKSTNFIRARKAWLDKYESPPIAAIEDEPGMISAMCNSGIMIEGRWNSQRMDEKIPGMNKALDAVDCHHDAEKWLERAKYAMIQCNRLMLESKAEHPELALPKGLGVFGREMV